MLCFKFSYHHIRAFSALRPMATARRVDLFHLFEIIGVHFFQNLMGSSLPDIFPFLSFGSPFLLSYQHILCILILVNRE